MSVQKTMKYKYSCRPGYGSELLLIEFTHGVEEEDFETDLLDAIKSINPQVTGLSDLWVNEEMRYTVSSDLGQFQLDKDNWGLAFIIAYDNQACILQIDSLFLADYRFHKIEVDFSEF